MATLAIFSFNVDDIKVDIVTRSQRETANVYENIRAGLGVNVSKIRAITYNPDQIKDVELRQAMARLNLISGFKFY